LIFFRPVLVAGRDLIFFAGPDVDPRFEIRPVDWPLRRVSSACAANFFDMVKGCRQSMELTLL
jgi:hypothetical protein